MLGLRCPSCGADNDEGASICGACSRPLTAYAGDVTGYVRAETVARAASLQVRPRWVPWIAGLEALMAIFGPFGSVVSRFSSTPSAASNEGTGYIFAAIGTAGAAITAFLLVPVGLILLLGAYGVMTQRSWAWNVTVGVLAILTASGVLRLGSSPVVGAALIGAGAAGLGLWFRNDTREWYGTQH